MLFSESFIFTSREDPKAAECRSHSYLLRGCFIYMVSSGVYAYLPLGQRVLNNVTSIIRKRMNDEGAQEILMSVIQPLEMWKKTGRDKDLNEVMFQLADRKKRQICLGPTHEEEITEIARRYLFSHRQLPFILYQIQTKFRDEPRPRFGLLRSCEFIMKDGYSFDRDQDGLSENYQKMLRAYERIFGDCGLDCVKIEADSGVMGGSLSHEFMVPSQIGEDTVFFCDSCRQYSGKDGTCGVCGKKLQDRKAIELGHVFQLGTKYSRAQNAFFLDTSGERKPVVMGCYGIGVSRIIAALAQVNSDEKGLSWPEGVAPYDVSMVVIDKSLLPEAIAIGDILEREGFSVLIDDRDEAAGVKFNDAYLIGNPYIFILGKKYSKERIIDAEIRKTKQKIALKEQEVAAFLKKRAKSY